MDTRILGNFFHPDLKIPHNFANVYHLLLISNTLFCLENRVRKD